MTEENNTLHSHRVRIKFGTNSDKLSVTWLDENCKGTWSIGKNTDSYDLYFENEEDAILTWWKWS